MVVLVPIWGTPSEKVNARHAPSLTAALWTLWHESGIMPLISPGGGSRTLAEAWEAGSGPDSDHYENNAKGRAAIDLNNQRAYRNWNEPRFIDIMRMFGWENIDISGNDFSREPWHFANHDINPWQPEPELIKIEDTDEMKLYRLCTIDGNPTGGYHIVTGDGRFKFINEKRDVDIAMYMLGINKVEDIPLKYEFAVAHWRKLLSTAKH